MGCPATYKQIDEDLAKFKEIDHAKVAKEAVERFGRNNALVHYSIIKNKVCYPLFLVATHQVAKRNSLLPSPTLPPILMKNSPPFSRIPKIQMIQIRLNLCITFEDIS